MITLGDYLNSLELKIGRVHHIRFVTNSIIAFLKLKDEDAQDYYIESIHLVSADHAPYVKLELVAINDSSITKDKYVSISEAEDLPITLDKQIFTEDENANNKVIACYVNQANIDLRNKLRKERNDNEKKTEG